LPEYGLSPQSRKESNVSAIAANTTVTIIPSLRYRNALAAIDWLCKAFGFEKQAVYADGDSVHHAQLTFGNGMIMLGSVSNDNAWGRRIAHPMRSAAARRNALRDRRRCRRALHACKSRWRRHRRRTRGQEYGGKGYSCRDPEGHLWWFGTHDPWKA
jgi:uncharacterized glyoxalase superfamily protein PhnB